MKINEFIEKLENNKEVYPVKSYIPFQSKRIIARDVLERFMDDSDGFIKIDNTMAYVHFYMNLICEYFGVEIEDAENDYDVLMSTGFALEGAIAQDIERAYKVFECEEKNLMTQNSIEAQVARVANSLVEAIDALSEKMSGAIDEFDMSQIVPEGTDVNELIGLLKKLK